MMMRAGLGMSFLLWAALGAGCATAGDARHSTRLRGHVVVEGRAARPVAEGPLMLRAYAANQAASLFMVPATGRGDADCVSRPLASQALTRDRVAVVRVPAGMLACVAASGS